MAVADQLVLPGLDRRDDVAHLAPRARSMSARIASTTCGSISGSTSIPGSIGAGRATSGARRGSGAEGARSDGATGFSSARGGAAGAGQAGLGERVLDDAEQAGVVQLESAAPGDALRVLAAGGVEARDGRHAPVDDQQLVRVVLNRATADIERASVLLEVDPPEAQCIEIGGVLEPLEQLFARLARRVLVARELRAFRRALTRVLGGDVDALDVRLLEGVLRVGRGTAHETVRTSGAGFALCVVKWTRSLNHMSVRRRLI